MSSSPCIAASVFLNFSTSRFAASSPSGDASFFAAKGVVVVVGKSVPDKTSGATELVSAAGAAELSSLFADESEQPKMETVIASRIKIFISVITSTFTGPRRKSLFPKAAARGSVCNVLLSRRLPQVVCFNYVCDCSRKGLVSISLMLESSRFCASIVINRVWSKRTK